MKFHVNLTVTQYDKSKDVITDDSVDADKLIEALYDCGCRDATWHGGQNGNHS